MAERIELTIGEVTTAALISVPAGAGPFPGVVAAFHRGGLDGFTGWLVDELAANGYGAIAPDHYHALPEGVDVEARRDYLTDEQMALDLEAAADRLIAEENIDADRLALIGHCMGGRTTWVGLATTPGRWRCGCVWYGGNAFRRMGKVPAPADRLGDIACPVAGFFGNDDRNPSPDDVDKLDAMLTALGKAHEFHRYDGAGHAFMSGKGEKYRKAPAKDSWSKALDFLGRHLGRGASPPT
ncbi:MAG: dienelactone hydrolase family protein [Alphaproteobacteria bacterium]|nr:dienelactone hydrolase family protein [Alphaproteobacteria bacterium]